MLSGGHLAGRGAHLGIDSQEAEALARAVEAGEACRIGSYCATPAGGGEQSAEDLLGQLYATSSLKFGSISWGSIPAGLHRCSVDRANDA